MGLYLWNGTQYVQIDDGSGNINVKNRMYDADLNGIIDSTALPSITTTFSDETANRAIGTTYQNTTGKTLLVVVVVQLRIGTNDGGVDSGSVTSTAYVDSATPPAIIVSSANHAGEYWDYGWAPATHVFLVPNGYYYLVSGGVLLSWMEATLEV